MKLLAGRVAGISKALIASRIGWIGKLRSWVERGTASFGVCGERISA